MAGSRTALLACLVPALVATPAHAQFVIKQPAVTQGELSIVGHGSYESALPDGGDPLGWGHEIELAYGFTDFWKSELALELKQPVHEELETTELKFENYLELADYAPWGVVFAAFAGVNMGVEEGVANAAKFGPLARFGDISDLGDVPSFNDTELRVGPVLYLSWRSDQSHFGFTGDIGVLLGTTDATPDTTIKWDVELTF